jgi:hypothetical protein
MSHDAVVNRYALVLADEYAGRLSSVYGGYAAAILIANRSGSDPVVRKHVAGVKYQDIIFTCGTGMSKEFYDWLVQMTSVKVPPKAGAFDTLDYIGTAISRLRFANATIATLALPALDSASRDPAEFTVTLTPEATEVLAARPSGALPPATRGICFRSNYRLEISGLDCSQVDRIDTIHVSATTGSTDDSTPFKVEVSNISMTLPESSAHGFYDWFSEFVIKGRNGRDQLKSGSLKLLSQDLKDALFTFDLRNIGIAKIAPEPFANGSEAVRRVRIEMYLEEIIFAYSHEAVG